MTSEKRPDGFPPFPVNPKSVPTLQCLDFNPEDPDADAFLWCAVADFYFDANPLEGEELINAVRDVLKGSAFCWLTTLSRTDLTWPQFRKLFLNRFVTNNSMSGTFYLLNDMKPEEGESLSNFGRTILAALTEKWKDASVEEIITSTCLALVAQHEPTLKIRTFANKIITRELLEEELGSVSRLKRKAEPSTHQPTHQEPPPQRFKRIQCTHCGKLGHTRNQCFRLLVPSGHNQYHGPRPLVCSSCGMLGHVAMYCRNYNYR